jgi:hypothetical protein
MGSASLGGIRFRIDPSQVSIPYKMNVAVTQTVGGRVVQVHGVTFGDMTIRGLFGQDRANRRESWQLAEDFSTAVGKLVDKQSARPTMAQLTGTDPTPMHPTLRFLYNDESSPSRRGLPVHDWDFNVYIKSLREIEGESTVSHTTGKFSYGYTLTLFIVQDNTGKLAQVAQNAFIDRLSKGLGWKRGPYNGLMTAADLASYLQSKGAADIHSYVLQQYQNSVTGTIPGASAQSGQGQQGGS